MDWQTFWGAISRAVRSPSRIDRDYFSPAPPVPPGTFNLAGGPDFESEKVIAYELGYRVRPAKNLMLSLASFYNDYDDIRSVEPLAGDPLTVRVANGLRSETWGAELSGNYQLSQWWRLRGGYTYLHRTVFLKPGSSDVNGGQAEGDDPENQFVLQSLLNLPHGFELDAVIRYVDRLNIGHVPSYLTADVRLAWWPRPNLELSLVGQNLADNQHPEFGGVATRQEIPRSVFGKVTWRF